MVVTLFTDIKIAHEACEMTRNMATNEYQIKQEVDHGAFCKFFFRWLFILLTLSDISFLYWHISRTK